jgi:hypothetical protein
VTPQKTNFNKTFVLELHRFSFVSRLLNEREKISQ